MTVEKDACREAFEKDMRESGWSVQMSDGIYVDRDTQSAWSGWHRAWNRRAALEAKPAATQGEVLPTHASAGLDSFVTRLEKALRDAAPSYPVRVNRRDLHDLLYHFIRLDNEARSIAAMPKAQPSEVDQPSGSSPEVA